MSALNIRVLGDPILRQKSKNVVEFDSDLLTFIDDMFETMYAAGGIGLAAPQVGRAERIAVVDIGDNTQFVLVNPVILHKNGSDKEIEGCLSIPDISVPVTRAHEVTVEFADEFGQNHTILVWGHLARCIQHEIDHLDGTLILDHVGAVRRKKATLEWEKLKANYPKCIRTVSSREIHRRRKREEM